MNNSIRKELASYIIEAVKDFEGTDPEELHQNLFNTNYYVFGYYNAEKWLKRHDVSVFNAIDFVQEYEKDNFGETYTEVNAESIVNMLVYIVGEELLSECDLWEYNEVSSELIRDIKNVMEEV